MSEKAALQPRPNDTIQTLEIDPTDRSACAYLCLIVLNLETLKSIEVCIVLSGVCLSEFAGFVVRSPRCQQAYVVAQETIHRLRKCGPCV